MSKKCTPLWREAHFKVKMYKTHQCRTTFGSWDVEKVHAVVTRSTFRSQNVQNTPCTGPLLDVQILFRVARVSKTSGSCGTFEEDLQRCTFRGRCSTRDMFIRDVRRWGRWFPERGCFLEHQICRIAKIILRDKCRRWSGTIAKRIGTRPSALHSTFHFEGSLAELFRFWCCQLRKLRTSRRIVAFLMLSTPKIVRKSEELFRFWCCQVQKLRKSRRIAAFSILQIDRSMDR